MPTIADIDPELYAELELVLEDEELTQYLADRAEYQRLAQELMDGGVSFDDIAEHLGISRECVRLAHLSGLQKLKHQITTTCPDLINYL